MRRACRPRGRIVARYEYRDAAGTVRFVVQRHAPKGFSVRSPNGRYPQIPYRLPELLAADPAATVWVVEGEKDADRLAGLGLVATTCAFGGGRGKWTRAHTRYVRGRSVVICPDNDKTGREHALDVAASLHRAAGRVRILHLPGLAAKGDVSDWLDDGHTLEELLALVENRAEDYRPLSEGIKLPRDWDDDDPEYFVRQGRERVYNLPLSATAKLFLLLLRDTRAAPLTQEQQAYVLGVSPRRVRQLCAQLAAAGHVAGRGPGRPKNRKPATY